MKPVARTIETAEAKAIADGLQKHYEMCAEMDRLHKQIDILTNERMELAAAVNDLIRCFNPHATDPMNMEYPKPMTNSKPLTAGIATLAARLKESANESESAPQTVSN